MQMGGQTFPVTEYHYWDKKLRVELELERRKRFTKTANHYLTKVQIFSFGIGSAPSSAESYPLNQVLKVYTKSNLWSVIFYKSVGEHIQNLYWGLGLHVDHV